MKDISSLLLELESLPRGYISRKIIHGGEYFYLQYKDGNKLISKYIPREQLPSLEENLKRRNEIEKEIKEYYGKGKPLNHLSPRTLELSGSIMMGDKVVAKFQKRTLIDINNDLAPLIIKRTHDLISFLNSRVIDTSRTNARLLKRILNIHTEEDYLIALKNHATSITDNYWFRSQNSRLSYNDVFLDSDVYNEISLKGDISIFPRVAKLSPQFSMLGSFEKCWRYISSTWYMYKNQSKEEILSEYIASLLSKSLGIPTAEYEMVDKYIRTKNFADKYNFEPLASLLGDNDSYEHVFDTLNKLDKELAKQYLALIWFDALVNNVDRHNENVGLLRDKETGHIVSLAPNFDLNMSLFSRNKVLTKNKDGFISLYLKFVNSNKTVQELYKEISLNPLTEQIIDEILSKVDLSEYNFDLKGYILYRYECIKDIL